MSFYISFEHIGGIEERHGRIFTLLSKSGGEKMFSVAFAAAMGYNNILSKCHQKRGRIPNG